jgi:hypothetical protein
MGQEGYNEDEGLSDRSLLTGVEVWYGHTERRTDLGDQSSLDA